MDRPSVTSSDLNLAYPSSPEIIQDRQTNKGSLCMLLSLGKLPFTATSQLPGVHIVRTLPKPTHDLITTSLIPSDSMSFAITQVVRLPIAKPSPQCPSFTWCPASLRYEPQPSGWCLMSVTCSFWTMINCGSSITSSLWLPFSFDLSFLSCILLCYLILQEYHVKAFTFLKPYPFALSIKASPKTCTSLSSKIISLPLFSAWLLGLLKCYLHTSFILFVLPNMSHGTSCNSLCLSPSSVLQVPSHLSSQTTRWTSDSSLVLWIISLRFGTFSIPSDTKFMPWHQAAMENQSSHPSIQSRKYIVQVLLMGWASVKINVPIMKKSARNNAS